MLKTTMISLFLLPCLALATSSDENPMWYGPAESPPNYIVPPHAAQPIVLSGQPELLAFSADSSELAIATLSDTGHNTKYGPIFAAELYAVSTIQPRSGEPTARRADLLISKDATAPFAIYGSPPVDLRWRDQKIELTISDGDDDIEQLTYDKAQNSLLHRTQDPTSPTEAERLALRAAIGRCFPDWPQDIINSGVNGIYSNWLDTGKTAVYQASHVNADQSVWYLNLAKCQRTPLLNFSKNHQQLWQHNHYGSVAFANHVLVVMGQRSQQSTRGHLKILLSQQAGQTPLAERRWQQVNSGLYDALSPELLGQVQQRLLFVLSNRQHPCTTRVMSLSAQGLIELKVDGYYICQAAVSSQGHLALALSSLNTKAAAEQSADTLWLIPPAFIESLPQ
jgi:hypothetical protein